MCCKNLFGSDIIVSDTIVARVNGKVTKIIKHNINVELITEHINLILYQRQICAIDEKICAKYNIDVKPMYITLILNQNQVYIY